MKLGPLMFSASKKGSGWRVTAINMGYAVCNRLGVVDISSCKAPWCLRSSVEVADPPSAALH